MTAAWLSRRAGRAAPDTRTPPRGSAVPAEAVHADLVATVEQFLEIARRVARMDAGAVFRLEADGRFQMIAERGATSAELIRLRSRPVEGSHAGEAVRAGRLVVTDLTQSPLVGADLRAAVVAAGHRTLFSLPIPTETSPWGVLALVSSEARALTGDETALLEAVTVQMGHAVTRAALAAEAREKGRRLETLARLTQTLTATLPLAEVLRRVVAAAVQIFGASESRLWLLDLDGRGLSLGASSGSDTTPAAPAHLAVGEGLVGAIVAQRAPLVVPDLGRDLRVRNAERARAAELVSFAGVPVMLGERIVAVLTIASRRRHEYTGEEIGLLESLAHHAAVVIDDARRFEEEQTRRAHLAALLDINKRIGAAESTDALLRAIADEAARLLQVDNAGFRLVEGDELVLAGLAGTADQTMLRPRIKIGESFSGRVVKEGRSIAANIAEMHELVPEHRAADERLGYTEFLGVPLRAGPRIIGALAFRARRPFTTRDRELAEAFADQAAVALEKARLYQEAQRQAERMRALADVERVLAERLDSDIVAQRIADNLRSLLQAQASAVYRLEPASENLEAIAVSGDVGPAFGRIVFPKGTGAGGRALRERRTVVTPDLLEDPAITLTPPVRARLEQASFRAVLAVPLRVHDRIIGALGVGDRPGRLFGADDIRLAEAFADQAALALDNARLHEETERRRREAEVMADLARSINASLDLDTVLQRIAEGARELCGSDLARIGLREPESDAVVFRYGVGTRYTAYATFRVEAGKGFAGLVLATGRPFRTDDYDVDPRISKDYMSIAEAEGIVTALAAPIRIGSHVEGLLDVSNRSPRPFTERHEATLLQLAEHAAIAIQNARLYEGLEARAKRLRSLTEINRVVSSSLDAAEVLRTIARAAAELMASPFVAFWVADEGSQTLRISAVSDESMGADFPMTSMAFGEGATGWVAAHRRPLSIPDVFADERYRIREWAARHGVRSFYGVPILLQDTLLGVLAMNGRALVSITPDEESLFESFAAQAAVALQHARLYAEAQERLRETTTLLAVGQVLSQDAPDDELLRRVARELARAFGADMVGAYVLDEQDEALRAVAGYRVPEPLREWFRSHPIALGRLPSLLADWRAGRASWSEDPRGDERFDSEWVRQLPPHAVLFAPTRVRGESRGALFLVWWRTGRKFQPAEIRLIEGVAAQVGLALENTELARQREIRLKETETLLAASRTLSSTLDLDMLLRHFMRQITQAIGAEVVGVWMLGEGGERMIPKAGYRLPPDWMPTMASLQLSIVDDPFYAEAARTKHAVFARDVATDPRVPASVYTATPHRSQLFVPILAKGRLIAGFVAAWLTQSRDFSPGEMALLEAIAAQAGVALENARLFDQNRRQVEELTVLHELSRAVTGQLDEAALLDAIRRQLPRVLTVDKFVMLLVDESADELEVALRVQDGQEDATAPQRYPRSVGLASVILETGRPLRTADYAAECARRGIALPPVEGPPHWLGVPMMAGSTVLGVLTVSRRQGDFTDAEERVTVSIADLAALALRSARLFEERTRAYSELAAAQDHLIRTEKLRALGEMASGVAHDFNNLLAAILGRAQLLLRRVEDPRLRQWLQVIERSAVDGAQTVRRLQEFARVRRDEPLVPVDLNGVVRDALEITQSRWREEALRRGVMVDVQTRLTPIPPVAGDAAELREVMTNLILNAVDAMPNGGSLTLASATVDGQAELTVSDTGVGIPEAIREKIFDPFFTTKGPQGTGLGLSMTYGIVSRHGATISVESEEGRGSTFRLVFPPLAVEGMPAVEAPAPATPMGTMRCLVIDDEESVGEVIGDVLETLGHRAEVLADGARAIERFRAEPFDVVFTDLAMPGLSGWQIAQAVKAMAPAVPVFVVTGFGVELSAEERRAHGVEAIFSKPLRIEDVMHAMEQVARKRSGPA